MKRRQPPQTYPQLVATDEILSLTKHHIETLRKARNDIVRDVTPQNATFENVVRPLINAQHTIEDSSGMITVLRYASPDTATRKAAEVARDLWNEAFSEFSDRQDIYILIQAVKNRAEPLDPESTRYPEELLADFVRCGHGVPTREGISDTKQIRAVAITDKLAKFYIDSNGKRKYPSTVLMCNFATHTPAGPSSCAVLKHFQVVSLFHELGHGLHDLVSRTQYSRFHGWRSPPDYAEALSIMLENWCWLPEELKQLSCHYTTLCPGVLQEWQLQHPNEPTPPISIPDSLVDPLIQHRHAFRALYMLGQLADARFDMAVHDPPSQAACAALDPTTLYTSLHEQLTFESTSPGERGHPHADFTHLLSGYDAGCYSYLSAQVFAADLFAEFKDDPRTQETWERYRATVLERGASMDELQNLCDFLGRPPDAKALLLSS
ncbi:zincin [Aureobasidium subglaciale]|nr:zincin [Aureobasidium subglaciale]